MGGGLLVLGVGAYVFLVITARALGPTKYTALSVLWTLVFFAAPGVFFPLEQEVGRAVSARRAVGQSGGPIVRRAMVAGAVLAGALIVATLAASGPILHQLFDGHVLVLVCLLLSLPAYAASHTTRGTLSGNGRFGTYGLLLGGEGLLRGAGAIVFALVGFKTAGAFGLLVALAPVGAIVLLLPRERGLLESGPEAPWAELSAGLTWLLIGAVLSQGFVNASVPLVKILASKSEQAVAGQFQAGLIITRVPLFLFQAVQAALLPKLAGLAASGRLTDFRSGLRRLMIAVGAIAVAGTIGAFLVGPLALRIAFGNQFNRLGRGDLTYLALSSGLFMVTVALSQALLALRGHTRAAGAWLVGIVVLGAVTAVAHGLLFRVEMGLVFGSIVAVVAMGVELWLKMRAGVPPTAELLYEALKPAREIIEP